MESELKHITAEFEKDLACVNDPAAIEEIKVKYLGRKSLLNELFGRVPSLSKEEKQRWGRQLNVVKQAITAAVEEKAKTLQIKEEKIDLTFPSGQMQKGSRHVLSFVSETICGIFEQLGFVVMDGCEIEDEWHNFTALNFPLDHPSRDSFDTFYLNLKEDDKGGKSLLRCHTSPSQIRIMQNNRPPLAAVSPGRVYRPDEVDATHSFMFHQIEGFAVAEDISFAHLKGVLFHFAHTFFSPDVRLRFRPHFFPFTEPSAEVDISCILCHGSGNVHEQRCSVCKGKGWLEVLGCGMMHPNVLSACGINAKKYKGFAFGMGVERIAMLKYSIHDIRLFTENDRRFLAQF